jgi:hypothetical protein
MEKEEWDTAINAGRFEISVFVKIILPNKLP